MTTPQIIAHRGASYLAPENTLVAFRKAMEIGADGVEMDVQKTYDNELVIHHDYMVDMHTDISGQIYDLTMGELKALDFGSWKDAIYANERIATLQEALELCAGMEGTQVQLELKSPLQDDPDFVPRVLDAVRAAGLTDRLSPSCVKSPNCATKDSPVRKLKPNSPRPMRSAPLRRIRFSQRWAKRCRSRTKRKSPLPPPSPCRPMNSP